MVLFLSSIAISIQILELIQDKKAIDHDAFKVIHSDLDKLRAAKASRPPEPSHGSKPPGPTLGKRSPPPPGPPPKKPRTDQGSVL